MSVDTGVRVGGASLPGRPALPVHVRARPPEAHELAGIPWFAVLDAGEQRRALVDIKVVHVEPGERLCRVGRPVTFWFGVIDGLLKMSGESAAGLPITFSGLPPGGWFGEGTVIKREPYRYDIQALRKSTVAGLGVDAFHWLLDHSVPFNRFIIQQLNERLSQFIATREIDRLANIDARVAHSLALLFNPLLFPGVGSLLRITQQELGYLIGLSRQRINQALRALQGAGCIRREYGGLRVLDLEALRRYGNA